MRGFCICFPFCARLLIHFLLNFFSFFVILRDLYPRLIAACSLKSAQFSRERKTNVFSYCRVFRKDLYYIFSWQLLLTSSQYLLVRIYMNENIDAWHKAGGTSIERHASVRDE